MAEKFQLRGHTLEVWLRKNPIIADRELVIIPDENTFVIGNGKDKFSLLTRRPFGADAWEVLVKYGGYTGTREDFCRQLSDVMRMPEQQAGTLTNAGAGWNSFTFPREFVEECYVMLTVQDVADVLGIGLAHAYEVAHRKDFPTITLGSRIIVPRDKLMAWIEEQAARKTEIF